MIKVRLYAIGTSTTLESNKSLDGPSKASTGAGVTRCQKGSGSTCPIIASTVGSCHAGEQGEHGAPPVLRLRHGPPCCGPLQGQSGSPGSRHAPLGHHRGWRASVRLAP